MSWSDDFIRAVAEACDESFICPASENADGPSRGDDATDDTACPAADRPTDEGRRGLQAAAGFFIDPRFVVGVDLGSIESTAVVLVRRAIDGAWVVVDQTTYKTRREAVGHASNAGQSFNGIAFPVLDEETWEALAGEGAIGSRPGFPQPPKPTPSTASALPDEPVPKTRPSGKHCYACQGSADITTEAGIHLCAGCHERAMRK